MYLYWLNVNTLNGLKCVENVLKPRQNRAMRDKTKQR